jgi:hypothetical protein
VSPAPALRLTDVWKSFGPVVANAGASLEVSSGEIHALVGENGAERAEKELGARVRFVEPGDGSDREAGLRLLAAEGMDLVVGVGFIFTDDLLTLASEYPNVRFAGVDLALRTDEQGRPLPLPPDLAAV